MDSSELRAGYVAEQRAAARSTALLAGVVAIAVFPLWTVFDEIVLVHGEEFIGLRIGFEVAIVVAWFALRSARIGRRWPEPAAFLLVALPEIAISWMIPRTGDHIEPYLLGLSITIYASAFVIVWHWHLTALLVVLTGALVALFCVQAADPISAPQIATIVFYLGTAGAISIVGQIYRHRTGWLKFVTEAELADERQRNAVLVEELNQLSRQDPLTGIGNRRAWEERVVAELLRSERHGRALSVILCDLDDFKAVNDTLGHAAGDRVLRATAALLLDRVRATDFVVRFGGDEFCVLCPDTPLALAQGLADDIVRRARSFAWPDGLRLSVSVGVAQAQPTETDPSLVVQRADAAMYRAKRARSTVATS
ncbi:MAG: diguanylate cyclase protein [Ilumatobacteraceae bacterium]|nr:diguanylate cyclase protein [Ilumatobacteraceae bacterium]MCU1387313.1 diguanylate cyclase protein [Ilumatobacteraceae bacterium]